VVAHWRVRSWPVCGSVASCLNALNPADRAPTDWTDAQPFARFAAWGAGGELERVDRELSLSAREDAALRLRLGQVLEALGRSGGCAALGFSSLSAYALERCERSARWVEAARCLARRLEALPRLRAAVAAGQISWSMGELLARVACAG
jgi:hypothetical protein